jgi:hypothetical protein
MSGASGGCALSKRRTIAINVRTLPDPRESQARLFEGPGASSCWQVEAPASTLARIVFAANTPPPARNIARPARPSSRSPRSPTFHGSLTANVTPETMRAAFLQLQITSWDFVKKLTVTDKDEGT